MVKQIKVAALSIGTLLATSVVASSDEVMDKIIQDASPYMHHSCGSVLDTFGEDEANLAEIVRLMAMVSLYNRQIDVLAVVSDEEGRTALKDKFVEELEDGCDSDAGMLLAGADDPTNSGEFEDDV